MDKKYFALFGITAIAFVAFLEYMIVNNALPSLQNVFHISILKLQWLTNVYSIVMAVATMLSGRLGDMLGARKVFYFGVLLLIIGSLGAGLSLSFDFLLICRIIQSIGVATCIVLARSLIQKIFLDKTHYAMSFYASVTGLGLVLGPYIGGVIITYWDWRWAFFINIPFLILAFLLCAPFIDEFKAEVKGKIDWYGNILLILCLVGLIYGLVRIPQIGKIDFISIISLLVFIVALPILLWVENKIEFPILNLHFFTRRYFLLGAFSGFMAGLMVSCGMFFSPLFLQNGLLLSPAHSGLILLWFAIGVVVFAPIVGKMVKKIGLDKTVTIGIGYGFIAAIFYLLFVISGSIVFIIFACIFTGMNLANNNVAAFLAGVKGVGEQNAGLSAGTLVSIFNATAGIMVTLSTLIFHGFFKDDVKLSYLNASKNSFIAVFIFIIIVSGLVLFAATKIYKKE